MLLLFISEKKYCKTFKGFLERITAISIIKIHTRIQRPDYADGCSGQYRASKLSVFLLTGHCPGGILLPSSKYFGLAALTEHILLPSYHSVY